MRSILRWIVEIAAYFSRLFSRNAKQDKHKMSGKRHDLEREYASDENEEEPSKIYPLW